MKVVSDGGDRNWQLRMDDGTFGHCHNMSHDEALDCFAANWPELAGQLDELRVDELAGEQPQTAGQSGQVARREHRQACVGIRKPGSGARFRELMAAGASNAEALAIVRAEFPDSKATLSDAAWNRAKLQKETAARGERPSGGWDVGELL